MFLFKHDETFYLVYKFYVELCHIWYINKLELTAKKVKCGIRL